MVRVVGLINTPQHNGKAGRIMGFVQASKRYQVLIRESGPDTRLALLERNLSPDSQPDSYVPRAPRAP